MLNVNAEIRSTLHCGIKISRKIKSSPYFSKKRTLRSPTPYHFSTTNHYFVNEEETPLSSIEDPLWKHVCMEVHKIMPALFIFRLSECQLGHVHSHSKQVDLYCPQGTINAIGQYDFVILGCLQKFFPTLKKIRVKTTSGKNLTESYTLGSTREYTV